MAHTSRALPAIELENQSASIDLRSGAALLSSKMDQAGLSNETNEIVHYALSMVAEAEQKLAEQIQRISQLENLVMTDELTQLYNRRGFQDHLNRAIGLAKRTENACGVIILIDLDKFKTVNDTYGHCAGDKYLRDVGNYLFNSVRSTDVVSRLGGDEFTLILSRTDEENGRRRAREILEGLNKLHCDYENNHIPIKASYGVAAYNGFSNLTELLNQADQELYKAKD